MDASLNKRISLSLHRPTKGEPLGFVRIMS